MIPTQAPFYPIEATAKGATASEYGLVTASLSYHQDQRNTIAIAMQKKDHQAGRPFIDPFLIFLLILFGEKYSEIVEKTNPGPGLRDYPPNHVHRESSLWQLSPTSRSTQGLQLWGKTSNTLRRVTLPG